MDDIIVDIPNVGQVAFPSSMSEQEINTAAKRLYDESVASQPQEPGMASQIGRQLGLTGRAAIEGIAALPNIIADPFARMAGITPPSQALSRTLTRAGFPEPGTGIERAVQAGAQAVAGAGGQIGLAREAAQAVTGPVARGFSQQVAQAPGTQLTAASVAAPVAQQVTEVTESPVAGMAAGVLAGGATGIRRGQDLPPVAKQLRDEANKAYQRAENAGLVVQPAYVQNIASKLSTKAFSEGFDPGLHPQIAAVLRRLEDEGANPKTLRELDQLRRIVRAPAGTFDNPDQQRIARNMVDEFDSLVENISAANVQAGANKDVALSALKQARNVYTKSRKVSIIEDMVDAAQTRGAQQTQAGLDNTLRNQFANLATNKKRMAAFSKTEQDEIKRIARGGGNLQQMLRFTGRFAVRGPVSGIFAGGATAMDPMIGIPLTLTAEGAKRGAEALRQRDVSRLIEQIAQQQLQTQPSLVPLAATRGLLSTQGME
jgi:hypothetical protein